MPSIPKLNKSGRRLSEGDSLWYILKDLEAFLPYFAANMGGGGGGDASAANQLTEITKLTSIDSKLVDGNDIGDVTINNAAGAGAVNIQDGGNSITVDGTVASTQSGTWNINNISGAVSLPTGAATSALQTTGNTSLSNIDTSTNNIELYTQLENWDKITGNSKEFTWADGTVVGNRIVTTIVYKTGVTTILTQTFAYNANDEVTSITAS